MSVQRTPEKSTSVPDMTTLEDEPLSNYITARNNKRRPTTTIPQLQEKTKDETSELHDLLRQFTKEQDKKINTILTSLKDIQETNKMIQTSITFLSEENLELKNKIAQLEIETKRDKEKILLMEAKFEDSQRTERKANIEIRNVPLKGNETKKELLEMVTQLSNTIRVDLSKRDVKDIIKINKNKKGKATLVVEFTNTFIKTDMLKAAKDYNAKNKDSKLRALHLGLKSNHDIPIFISENLTLRASRLHFLARDLKISKQYKYCWTSYGRVYLRIDDNSPIIMVTNEEQIQQLYNK
jgi:hypothetical protein